MLESAIPALWSTVHGWFTPAVLFVVLNIVIGTIAVSSKVTSAAGSGEGAGDGGEKRGLSRVPSMALDRLRSFKLSRHAAPFPEPPVAGVVDLGSDEYLEKEEEVADQGEEQEHPRHMERSRSEAVADQGEEQEHPRHMERSRSEAAAEAELPRLPARLRKSASDKSAFAHFVAAEAVEARRPATTRDGVRPRRPLAEAEEPVSEEEPEEAGGEVDARADDFINKFRQQLKLQRIDSFMRYRDTLRRGQATTAQQ